MVTQAQCEEENETQPDQNPQIDWPDTEENNDEEGTENVTNTENTQDHHLKTMTTLMPQMILNLTLPRKNRKEKHKSNKYCKPVLGGTLVSGDNSHLSTIANLETI